MAKKAKLAKSVEVTSPRVEFLERTEDTGIVLHSFDFQPLETPDYTPISYSQAGDGGS